jgi:putative transport protein
MSLVGAKHDVERAAKELGYADRATVSTDMIFVALGIFFGDWWGCLRSRSAAFPLP